MSFEKWSEKYAPAVALVMSILAFICAVAAFMNMPEKMPSMPKGASMQQRGPRGGGGGMGMRPGRGVSREYIKLYQDRVRLLTQIVESNELQFQTGALPLEDVVHSRFTADCGRVMLARLEMGGRPSPGLTEAVMAEKYWAWDVKMRNNGYKAGNVPAEKYWNSALEWNQARLNLSRMEFRIVNNPEFQKAVEECLKNYPDGRLSDEQIKRLVETERAF